MYVIARQVGMVCRRLLRKQKTLNQSVCDFASHHPPRKKEEIGNLIWFQKSEIPKGTNPYNPTIGTKKEEEGGASQFCLNTGFHSTKQQHQKRVHCEERSGQRAKRVFVELGKNSLGIWRRRASIPLPPVCETGALPFELLPR